MEVLKGNPMKLTKAQVLSDFRQMWEDSVDCEPRLRDDIVAKRESWNNFTDFLCKGGEITMNQYNNWTNPF